MTTTAVKSRPILFSGPMVRAILDGRKTQTRRAVKLPPDVQIGTDGFFDENIGDGSFRSHVSNLRCPYGQPGDELWVRETWVECLHTSPATDEPHLCDGDKLIEHATSHTGPDGEKRWNYDGRVICYRATSDVEFCDGDGFRGDMANRDDMPRWRPSIHMPRWASRITLTVKDVRVERLQDISESDAYAEGCGSCTPAYVSGGEIVGADGVLPSDEFRDLWQSINGPDSWDANQWVWVVEFQRKETN